MTDPAQTVPAVPHYFPDERSMRQRMETGEAYLALDDELGSASARAQRLTEEYNATTVDDGATRTTLLQDLLGTVGEQVEIRPPFNVDYGRYISIGDRTFANFGLIALDIAPITIGADVQIGPRVQLITASHPVEAGPRRAKWESGEPIVIGDNVWLGAGVVVGPGVTIGANTVVGAGAVVTRDLPADVVAVGVPARPIKSLPEDPETGFSTVALDPEPDTAETAADPAAVLPGGAEGTPNKWTQAVTADPEHSQRYAQRWRRLAAEGLDVDGEARLINALAERESRIFDAGCGTGRTGGHLAAAGHSVVGVDLDPHLIEVARTDFPDATWFTGDLEHLEASLSEEARAAVEEPFDLVVSAGNVFGFLASAGRRPALRALHELLASGGRAVVGYGAGRGYSFTEFLADAEQVGFTVEAQYSTWTLQPFTEDSDFLVAVLCRG
ncbi:MAG: methyltransferase domain-containing protein [Micrococcaceae bacterium]